MSSYSFLLSPGRQNVPSCKNFTLVQLTFDVYLKTISNARLFNSFLCAGGREEEQNTLTLHKLKTTSARVCRHEPTVTSFGRSVQQIVPVLKLLEGGLYKNMTRIEHKTYQQSRGRGGMWSRASMTGQMPGQEFHHSGAGI